MLNGNVGCPNVEYKDYPLLVCLPRSSIDRYKYSGGIAVSAIMLFFFLIWSWIQAWIFVVIPTTRLGRTSWRFIAEFYITNLLWSVWCMKFVIVVIPTNTLTICQVYHRTFWNKSCPTFFSECLPSFVRSRREEI